MVLTVVRFLITRTLTRALPLVLGAFALAGCSLKSADKSASVSLILPNPNQVGPRVGLSRMGIAPATWNSTSFACYGVNVTGPGISDTSMNPSVNPDLAGLVAGTTSCAYRGIVSNGFTFPAGGGEIAIDLQVPSGPNRVIQLVGITNPDFCGSSFLQETAAGTPFAYEIGRVKTDLFSDLSVSIPITYSASESKRVDCPNGSLATIAPTVEVDSHLDGEVLEASSLSTFVISGTCSEEGEAVTVDANTVIVSDTCSSGAWSVAYDLATGPFTADGPISFTVVHQNSAGDLAPTVYLSLTKDTVAPVVTINTPPQYINLSNQNSFPLSGTCTEDGSIELTGAVTASGIPCSGGVWSTALNMLSVAEGTATLSATIDDDALNTSTAVSVTRTKDTVPPTTAILSPNGGQVLVGLQPQSITWTPATDSGSGVSVTGTSLSYSTDGGTSFPNTIVSGIANSGTYATWTPPDVNSSQFQVKVTVVDNAGNSFSDASDTNFTIERPATQLSFTNVGAPTTLNVDACYGPIEVQTMDANNNPRNVTSAITPALTGAGYVNFFSDPICMTAPLTTVNISAGASLSPSIYYRAANPSSGPITATYSGFSPANRSMTAVFGLGTWSPMSLAADPGLRFGHTAVFDSVNSRMIVWGGNSSGVATETGLSCTGSTCTPISTSNSGGPRVGHTATIVGTKMVVIGGFNGSAYNINIGYMNLSNGTWTSPSPTLLGRKNASTVDDGTRVWTFGGFNGTVLASGESLNASTDAAGVMFATAQPSARIGHASFFYNNKVYVWGGSDGGSNYYNTGAAYDTGANTWTSMSLTNAPSSRVPAVAVWTGSRFIVWGGKGPSGLLNDGAAYDPITDTWSSISSVGAPRVREKAASLFVSVGAGKVVVWGGIDSSPTPVRPTVGGLYDVASNTWTTINPTGLETLSGAESPSLVFNPSTPAVWMFGGQYNTSPKLHQLTLP